MRILGNLTGKGIVVADGRLHTTVIELRLKWNGHHFVAVTNISFSICSRGRRYCSVPYQGAINVFQKPVQLS